MSIWRPLPLGARRTVARTVSRSPAWAPLRALARLATRPIPVWIAFSVNLVVWHIPAAYDLAVQHRGIHDLEHTTFLLFGVLLWAQVLPSPPLRMRLDRPRRVAYIVTTAVVSWVIALVLTFATSPLYPYYAHLTHRPGGISALNDQQLAGGVMLVPGSLTMTLFVFIELYLWVGRDERDGERREPVAQSAPLPGGPPNEPPSTVEPERASSDGVLA